jgi:hypothetical protein
MSSTRAQNASVPSCVFFNLYCSTD